MLIFKDIITGDELFSDGFPMVDLDGIAWEVESKQISKSTEGDFDIGANASAEGGGDEDGVDENVVTVNNLADAHGIVPTAFDKKSYTIYIKGYMKNIKEKLEETNPERIPDFQKGAANLVKKILGNFKEYDFYTGESMNPEGMVPLVFYKEDGLIPYWLFFKDGLEEEKV